MSRVEIIRCVCEARENERVEGHKSKITNYRKRVRVVRVKE